MSAVRSESTTLAIVAIILTLLSTCLLDCHHISPAKERRKWLKLANKAVQKRRKKDDLSPSTREMKKDSRRRMFAEEEMQANREDHGASSCQRPEESVQARAPTPASQPKGRGKGDDPDPAGSETTERGGCLMLCQEGMATICYDDGEACRQTSEEEARCSAPMQP